LLSHFGVSLVLLFLAFVRATPSPAQELARATRVTEENDFLDVALPAHGRPDDNYTQGLHLSRDVAGVPSFVRRWMCPARHACASTLELGQDMYTPTEDAPQPIPGQRPYAGWLYVRASTAAATVHTRRTIGITLGVTGRASLAEQTQAAFHRLIPRFRRPLGWSHQLPTEPDVAIDAESAWYVSAPGRAARWADVVPTAHATAGTLRTALGVGGRARVGFPLTHPWLVNTSARAWEVYVFVGGQLQAVGRDLFLDGSTFHRSVRVAREPLVSDWERGIGVRLWQLGVEYRVVTQGRRYRDGPVAHPFGGITITWWTRR
jgi:hypothetical protein